MTKAERELLRQWGLRQKSFFGCRIAGDGSDWEFHLAAGKVCHQNPNSPFLRLRTGAHPRQIPGEFERRQRLALRCVEQAGPEFDSGEVENAAMVFLDENPAARDGEVLEHVGDLAADAGLRPPWDAAERGRYALAVEQVVAATLDAEAVLPDERLRAIAAEFYEREPDIEVLRRRYFADPLRGAPAEPLTVDEAAALRRDRAVLRRRALRGEST